MNNSITRWFTPCACTFEESAGRTLIWRLRDASNCKKHEGGYEIIGFTPDRPRLVVDGSGG